MQAFARRLGSFDHLGLLALRIGVGVIMAWHGWQKVGGGVTNFAGFVLMAGALALFFLGAGRLSIDQAVGFEERAEPAPAA